jgi:hypothetical protein
MKALCLLILQRYTNCSPYLKFIPVVGMNVTHVLLQTSVPHPDANFHCELRTVKQARQKMAMTFGEYYKINSQELSRVLNCTYRTSCMPTALQS